MTDEEKLAEEYTEISLNENEYEECLIDFHDVVILKEAIKKAYLAGLAAGKDMGETDLATIAYMQGAERYKTKWHDLRKNPNDLPLNF